MADYVTRYTSKASDELEKRIKRVYRQAAKEVQKKLDDFIRGHKARNAQMLQMVSDGKMSKQDYQKWMRGQVFQGDQWKQKLKDVTDVYVHADEKAREIVGGTSKNVFMEAANYTAYDLEKGMRGAVAFNVYDAKTVERLLKKDPKMLPEWKIDQPKDYKWNEKRVRNAVAQGIIQGESVEEVGERLTGELATSNATKMDMFARTAINGAQNAGRMDRLHEAEEMGIEVRKKWLATLDQRTRDTHQALDGQEQPIDEPFVVDGMKIDYPGDPFAPPELVYNCFVGETSAYTNCEIERSYCHEYKGELIEIETSCGVKFTCTPNHPILTLGGWVSAASLHNGDDLLVTKVGNRLGFGRNCNVKHVLSCMKTFHDSFKGSGLVSRNSTLSVNFHGDIPTSEVEIITKKRFLPDNRNPGISERIKKFLFELPYKAFACKCSFMKHLWRIGFSTFSFICGKCKSFPLFWGRFGHSQKHGLRPIALFNPGGVQPLNDNVAGNIQIISNCLDGFTGIVLADNIISVNKCSGRAHVYNLQTENGYYFVNTIITKSAGKRNGFAAISHNCRCTLTYVYPKYQHLQHNHERRDQLNDKNIEDMTYYEWVGLKKRTEQEKTEEVFVETISIEGLREVAMTSSDKYDFWLSLNEEQQAIFKASGMSLDDAFNTLHTASEAQEWKSPSPGGAETFAIKHDYTNAEIKFEEIVARSDGWMADANDAGTIHVRKGGLGDDWEFIISHEAGHQLANFDKELQQTIISNPGNVFGRYNIRLMAFDGVYGEYNPDEAFATCVSNYVRHQKDFERRYPDAFAAVDNYFRTSPSALEFVKHIMTEYGRKFNK